MSIYIGANELKSLKKGTSDISEVYVGDTKVRPISKGFATKGPCPDGFHVPLQSERYQIYLIAKVANNNREGFAPFNNYFKMPNARDLSAYNGSKNSYNVANYWSSSASGDKANSFYLTSSSSRYDYTPSRATGCTIRAFKDEPIIPDSNWTLLYGSMSRGIYYNSTEGLISCTWDGGTWYTMMDKNLGATVVYNNGDGLNAANCGNYYQRGNNYGFSYDGGFTTSSSQIDASDYGPKNYYSSDIFRITGSSDWSSVKNDNLRGGVDGNVPV